MRVLLNVESLHPPLTGIGRYTANVLAGLADRSDLRSLTCFSGMQFIEPAVALRMARHGEAPSAAAEAPAAAAPANRMLRSRYLRALARRIPGAYRLRAALNERMLRSSFRRIKEAVYHEPNFILREHEGPTVVTIHDLSVFHYPHFHPQERVDFMTRNMPQTFERANRFVTPCEFVRQELVATFGIHADRVHAVPLGVDAAFAPRTDAQLQPVLVEFGLQPRGYLLSVATFEPRKNLERLVRAYMRLAPALRQRHPLVLAGAPGWRSDAIEALLARGERDGSVRRLGYVDETRLPYLYAGATLFAFPSVYEGFGLPLLEAMACGAPVVSSQTSSMPEVVGDAGLAVDPLDEDAISAALARGLQDEAWRAQAAARGLERAARFTWEDCVARTVEVYRLAQAG